MLSKIITKVNWRIISCLIEKEATLSEIARETDTTKANTHYALKELEKHGLVRKKVLGRTHLYRFNVLHSDARAILQLREQEKKTQYSKKLNNLPNIIHSFLQHALQRNYRGCIFFGSSLDAEFNDIDVFIIVNRREKTKFMRTKLKNIDSKISPLFGTIKEIEKGSKNEDMLYKNITKGIPFGTNIINIKYEKSFLRREDISERFIIGYREVLSCLDFEDKGYHKKHFEKGIIDIIYAILNYYDYEPRNDKEAIELFKEKLNECKPKTIKQALQLVYKYGEIL